MPHPEPELRQAYESALMSAGVPVSLASQCAEVLVKDDPTKEDLGRTEDDQHLIASSMEWLKALNYFER
jgi:hypothetical protein